MDLLTPEQRAVSNDELKSAIKATIECVLLDHADQLSGDNVDANLSELAYLYERLTGWTVQRELERIGDET